MSCPSHATCPNHKPNREPVPLPKLSPVCLSKAKVPASREQQRWGAAHGESAVVAVARRARSPGRARQSPSFLFHPFPVPAMVGSVGVVGEKDTRKEAFPGVWQKHKKNHGCQV